VDIHERIRRRRTELGLSHAKLAERISQAEGLKTPLSRATVQQWEAGKTAPKRNRLPYVAQALEMTEEELMGFPASPTAVRDTPNAYTSNGWPFQVISRDQITQLSTQQLAGLEKAMVRHLLQPLAAEFRTVALEVAAEADQLNHDDTFTSFIRAVDSKLRQIADKQLAAAATT